MNSDDKEWFAEEGERQDTPPVKDDGSENNAYEVAKENDLPHTHEEVLQNLQHNGIDQNFLEREAHAKGIDFDQDEPDQFNRTNEE